jgi:hypothetical protein
MKAFGNFPFSWNKLRRLSIFLKSNSVSFCTTWNDFGKN